MGKRKQKKSEKRRFNRMLKRIRVNQGHRMRTKVPDFFERPDEYRIDNIRFVKSPYEGGIEREIAEQIIEQIVPDVQDSKSIKGYFHAQVCWRDGISERRPYIQIERGKVSWPQLRDLGYGPCDDYSYIKEFREKPETR